MEKKNCGSCNKQKDFQSQCMDCNAFLCGDCNKIHKNLPALKGHKLSQLSQAIKSLESSMQATVKELQVTGNQASQIKVARSKELQKINKSEEDAVKKLEFNRKKEIESINNRYNNQIKQLKDDNVKERNNLGSSKNIDSMIKDIKTREDKLKEIMEKKDKNEMLSSGVATNDQIKKELPTFQNQVKQLQNK